MYQKKKMILYALILLTGFGIIAASVMLDDHSYWGGIGGGLVGVGGMKLLQGLRYRKDGDFAREVDTGTRDERNQFLYDKARSWTCSFTFLALGVACIILRLAGLAAYSNVCSFVLCAMLVIYCLCYWALRKKY